MLYLPDTNVWINHLNPASSIVQAKLSSHSPVQIVLCDAVKAEDPLPPGEYLISVITEIELQSFAGMDDAQIRASNCVSFQK